MNGDPVESENASDRMAEAQHAESFRGMQTFAIAAKVSLTAGWAGCRCTGVGGR